MWELYEGLEFIRKLQPTARACNLHLALAGSVLNKGRSDKDLDVIILKIIDGDDSYFLEFMNCLREFGNISISKSGDYILEDREIHKLYIAGTDKIVDFFWYNK